MAFWHGCNYPWSTNGRTVFYGMDFGATIWGTHVGVSTRRPAIERDFEHLARLGFTVARWFVFCDGRSGIVYDDEGLPTNLDGYIVADMDAALELASRYGVRLALVFLDHRWMYAGIPDVVIDAATGAVLHAQLPNGRAHVLRTERGREALLTNVLTPLVARYGHTGARSDLASAVFAYELMNEPDFVVEEWERDLSRHVPQPLPFSALADLVTGLSVIVGEHSAAMTTMSAARTHNLWAWDDDRFGLDFVQVHSYPNVRHPERDIDVFGVRASALGLTRPIVLGEFPCDGPNQHPPEAAPPPTTLIDYLEFAIANGFVGAWPWSYSGPDGYGRVPVGPLMEFARRHPDVVNPRALDGGP